MQETEKACERTEVPSKTKRTMARRDNDESWDDEEEDEKFYTQEQIRAMTTTANSDNNDTHDTLKVPTTTTEETKNSERDSSMRYPSPSPKEPTKQRKVVKEIRTNPPSVSATILKGKHNDTGDDNQGTDDMSMAMTPIKSTTIQASRISAVQVLDDVTTTQNEPSTTYVTTTNAQANGVQVSIPAPVVGAIHVQPPGSSLTTSATTTVANSSSSWGPTNSHTIRIGTYRSFPLLEATAVQSSRRPPPALAVSPSVWEQYRWYILTIGVSLATVGAYFLGRFGPNPGT